MKCHGCYRCLSYPTFLAYPKDPQKNDVIVYKEAAAKSLDGQRYNITCHHKKSFDTESHLQYETKENNKLHHRKTQHFVRGKVLICAFNSLIHSFKAR